MALARDTRPTGDPGIVAPASPDERFASEAEDRDAGRSNFAAFLLGAVVIAGGLLAFLYYDTDNLSRGDSLTTGSITQSMPGDAPQAPPALRIPVQPNSAPSR